MLQNCIQFKKKIPEIEHSDRCLIPVYIQIIGKGNLTKHAMICIPRKTDVSSKEKVTEPHHDDENAKLRKQKRAEHKKLLKQMQRKRIKLRKKKVHVGKVIFLSFDFSTTIITLLVLDTA